MTKDDPDPVCCVCRRAPKELAEYRSSARAVSRMEWDELNDTERREFKRTTAREMMEMEEGTYNPEVKLFCCDHCYIEIGMPASPVGWVATAFMGRGMH